MFVMELSLLVMSLGLRFRARTGGRYACFSARWLLLGLVGTGWAILSFLYKWA